MKSLIKYCFIFISMFISAPIVSQETIDFMNDTVLNASAAEITREIKEAPEIDSLYYLRSIIYYVMKDDSSALNDINKAIELSTTENINYFEKKGYICDEMGDYDNSINCYKKVISLDSLYWDPYIFLIESYILSDNYYQAMSFIVNKLMPIYRKKPNRWRNDDGLHSILPMIFEIYRKEYVSDTTNFKALYGLGYISFQQKHIDDAIFCFERYKRITPEDKINNETMLYLGECYLFKGDTIQARKYYLEAYKNDIAIPDSLHQWIGIKE